MRGELKPGYKQTEVGVIPEDWDDLPLEEITKEDSPICYGIVQVGPYTPNGVPVLAIKNLNSDYATNIHCASVGVERPYARSRIRPEDVLVSVKGTTGRVGIVPLGFHGNISRDLARLRLCEGIVPRFVFQILQSDLEQQRLATAVDGTTRMELSIAILKKVRIPLPPTKAEQEAIAEALSDADSLIESLEQLVAKKRHIKQGAMQELLTGKKRLTGFATKPGYNQTEVGVIPEDWEFSRLGDCGAVVMGQSPPGASYNRSGFGSALINGPTEFTDKYPQKIQWTSEPTKFCKPGDLLICVRGSSTGRTNYSDDVYCIGRGVAAIRALSDNDTAYLSFQVISAVGDIIAATTGSTFPNINGKSLRAINIPLPPTKAEQAAIASILADMDAELAALEAKLAKARQLKQGMMQELLTGKIRLV
jgi:type I restriction enzyme, S subunit